MIRVEELGPWTGHQDCLVAVDTMREEPLTIGRMRGLATLTAYTAIDPILTPSGVCYREEKEVERLHAVILNSHFVDGLEQEAPDLSPEEDAGVEAAPESYRQGRVVDATRAREIVDAVLGR